MCGKDKRFGIRRPLFFESGGIEQGFFLKGLHPPTNLTMNLKMMISKIEIYFFQGASIFSFGMFVFFGEKNMLMCLLCEKIVVHREKFCPSHLVLIIQGFQKGLLKAFGLRREEVFVDGR